MKIRKITSLTALLSFFVLIITGVILFIVPQGRIAYWADWHLFGLTKTQWANIHINTAILFLLTICLHTYYNWQAIISYLQDQSKRLKIITPEFNIALIITVLFCLGTYFWMPPFSTILQINESIKDAGAEKYGEPPYGHAELSSLKAFANKMDLDLTECMTVLKEAGINIESENQTILEIAGQNRLTPKQIYDKIKPAGTKTQGNNKKLSAHPKIGLGKLTLSDICKEYGFDMNLAIKKLADHNIAAAGNMTLKTIATKHNKKPMDIYNILNNSSRAAAQK